MRTITVLGAKAAARARAEQEAAQWVIRATARAERLKKLQYPLSEIVIEYADEDDRMLAGLGDGTDILSVARIKISEEDGVVLADREGKTVRVRELFQDGDSRLFSAGALNAVCSAVLRVVNDVGVVGVSIMPHPDDIATDGRDLRPPGRTALRLLPRFSRVAQVRTIDADKPADDPGRIDSLEHQWVRKQSPVSPDGHDLLDRRSIDDYVARINRHPGRRASVAISQGERPGEAVLDYIVDESSPWRVMLQTSNTGTDTTDEIRHRLSLAHYQLTGHDDILSLDYVHSGSQVDAPARYIGGSYQYPFGPTFKTRVYASYSDYAADEIGQHDLEFEGESKRGGVDLVWNFYQRGSLFLDLQLGLRLDDFSTTDRQLDTEAAESVAMGSAGLSLEHRGRTSRTSASTRWDHSLPSIMGTEEEQLVGLGRSDVDAAWDVLVFNLAHSMYLDPFIFGTGWGEPTILPETTTV